MGLDTLVLLVGSILVSACGAYRWVRERLKHCLGWPWLGDGRGTAWFYREKNMVVTVDRTLVLSMKKLKN